MKRRSDLKAPIGGFDADAADAFVGEAAATRAEQPTRGRPKRGVPAEGMQRTSIDLPGGLHRRARVAALEGGVTLRDYLIAALEERLEREGR